MPLQVRLRHALGERVIELPERSHSHPLVVGRGRDADVQIPSISTAPRHCFLFIQEDQWFVQPTDGTVVVNGKAIAGPKGLRTGDVIALGEDKTAATLQIDPIGAAERHSGPVTAGQVAPPPRKMAVRPMAPVVAPSKAPAPAPRPAPPPTRRPPQVAAQATRVEETEGSEAASVENDAVDWNLGDSVPAATKFYVPKGQQTSGVLMVITILIGMGAVGGLGYYAYKATHKPPPPPIVIVEQTTPKVALAAKPKTLFDLDGDQAAARQAQAKRLAAASETSTSTPTLPTGKTQQAAVPVHVYKPPPASAIQEDPDIVAMRAQAQAFDPAWDEIERARHDVRHIGASVNKYDAYRRDHPGKNTAALDKFVDEAANWLYWQRISQLWKSRDELFAEIRHKDTDLKYQPPGAFHDQLEKDRADLVAKHDQANDAITNEMGYSGDTAPDLENPTQLQTLAQSRDPAKYAAFKSRVLKYVRDYHGALWWVSP